ncbi:AAA family ATPase [Micromonospora echinofusca]|uniref:AAA family ATPase n=1 Tax=Micromonospora echinofusca TaxID=47858 RepID=UPI0034441827
MRLTKIAFRGYRRLVDTECNVDSKIVAFVGANEAGKSSVFEALEWLTRHDVKLNPSALSRNETHDEKRWVVSATFILHSSDREALSLRFVKAPENGIFVLRKNPRAGRIVGTIPDCERDWVGLQLIADEIRTRIREFVRAEKPLVAGEKELINRLQQVLNAIKSKRELNDGEKAFLNLVEASDSGLEAFGDAVVENLKVMQGALTKTTFQHQCDVLIPRIPKFVLYDANRRSLKTRYDLTEDASTGGGSSPLLDLLKIAELDRDSLHAAMQSENTSRVKTFLKSANNRIEKKIRSAWQQSVLTIRLESEGRDLLVLIDELSEDGSTTTIEERSDGLRSFLAMACFMLASKSEGSGEQIILMIDEAERHLHYDAQADLINILMTQSEAQQVLYSTHSPGCLPPDLGTSVRLVEPVPGRTDASKIRSSFWGGSAVGFSPLLVAMGAGAAAFSACRRAVLAEGATEMILLPTLIRMATGLPQLSYQVAPGLSSLRRDGFGMDEISAKIAYLVDGDDGGKAKAKMLKSIGVADQLIISLPSDKVLEDLISTDSYQEAVRTLLKDRGVNVDSFKVDPDLGVSIIKRVADACDSVGATPPGKTAVANYMIQDASSRISLAPDAKGILVDLHRKFSASLGC